MADQELSLVEEFVQTKDGMRRILQARALRRATELIEALMEERQLSRSDLAAMIGRTQGWVTQLLDGEKNKTIRTVADVLAVLDRELDFRDREIQIGEAKEPQLKITQVWQDHCSTKLWPPVPFPPTSHVKVM